MRMDLTRLFNKLTLNKRTAKSVQFLGLVDDRLDDRLLEGVSWIDAVLVLFEPALSLALAVVDIGGSYQSNTVSCRSMLVLQRYNTVVVFCCC
jgi:hypothetical protein